MGIKKTWVVVILLLLSICVITGTKASEEEDKIEAERKALEEVIATLEELARTRDKEIADLLHKGTEYYLKEEFEKAIIIFNEVLIKNPENKIAESYLAKARRSFETQKEEEITREKEEERKVSLRERRTEAQKQRLAKFHLQKGDRYYRSQKSKLAIKEWEKVLSIQPENTEAQQRILKVKREIEGRERVAQGEDRASRLIEQGKVYFKQGEYDQAIAEWEPVLNLVPEKHPDHDRAEAWIRVAEAYRRKQEERGAEARKDILERSTLVGITEGWTRPVRKKAEVGEEGVDKEKPVAVTKLKEKAQKIVSVHFTKAHIRTVLSTLAELSGVNIVLDESVFPGGETFLEGQTSPRVTIDMDDLPLIQALRVILRAKNLAFRMEENLIWITTPERMARERLVTKVYSLLTAVTGPVLFEAPDIEEAGEGLDTEERRLGLDEEERTGPSAVTTETIIDTLRAAVPWPSGSIMNFDKRTGALIVRNTPTNLAILEELIRKIEAAPMQASIEAKFITLAADDARQLGIEYPYLRVGLGEAGQIEIERDTGYGIDFPHTSMEGSFAFGEGIALSYTKLDPTEFRMLLDVIEKTGSSNLLSAPQVMTRNQQEATIKVVREYRFPDFDAYEEFYYIYYADLRPPTGVEANQGVTLVPTSFGDVQEMGIILTVTPDIGSDMKTITLAISPQVNSLGDWVTYESILPVAGTVTSFIRYPTVNSATINTQIVISDGETIVMGGLMQEKDSERVMKVPFLGDIPILGRLFKRTATTSFKESLLIFITVNLVKPTGEKYRP